jgi:mRNA-degrading endonuclease toxin of MazEF toxin-antitoxin module
LSTEPTPARGEVWECTDGRNLLVIQHDRLIAELATVIGLIVTDVIQRAPEPVRIGLSSEATGLSYPLWVKVPLVVTVDRTLLERRLAMVAPTHMQRVEAALARVLNLRIVPRFS